jgi:hypothetical protein
MIKEEATRSPEHTPIAGKMPVTVLPVGALEGLCLIQNQVLPLDTIEVLEVCNNQLITCDHNVKTCFPCVQVLLVPKLTQDPAFLLVKSVPIKSVSQCKSHTSTFSELNDTEMEAMLLWCWHSPLRLHMSQLT